MAASWPLFQLSDAQRQWKGVEVSMVGPERLLLESMLSPSRHPKDIYGFCAAFTAALRPVQSRSGPII